MRRRKKTDDDKTYFNLLWIRNWATAIINLKKAPANTQTNDGECLLWIKKNNILGTSSFQYLELITVLIVLFNIVYI